DTDPITILTLSLHDALPISAPHFIPKRRRKTERAAVRRITTAWGNRMIILPAIDLKDGRCVRLFQGDYATAEQVAADPVATAKRSEEHTSELQSRFDLVCRL